MGTQPAPRDITRGAMKWAWQSRWTILPPEPFERIVTVLSRTLPASTVIIHTDGHPLLLSHTVRIPHR
eukprot:3917591-Rhodomonas_salina.1